VKLDRIEITDKGPVLHVSGIDLRDKTPIYDIKPYLPYVDCHPEAKGGFADLSHDGRFRHGQKQNKWARQRYRVCFALFL
jgi:tRNA (Thr-GGU) A37 N-methylase